MGSPSSHLWLSFLRAHEGLLLIACVALGVRLSFFLPVHANGFTSDEREYISMARQLTDGRDFVDSNGERSTRAPLFPFLLALLFTATGGSIIAAQLAGCLLGTGAVIVGYFLCLEIWNDRPGALVAAAMIAVYPGLVIYSGLLQTETLYIFFFLLALWFACRAMSRSSTLAMAGLGLASGLAALTRVVFLGFFPLLLVLMLARKKGNGGPGWAQVALAVALFCAAIAPWTIRNYEIHNALVPISSGGGNSLLTGNNPFATGTWRVEKGFEQWYNEQAKEFGVVDVTALGEVERSDLSAKIAGVYMRTHPFDVLRLWVQKAYIFFAYPITHSDSLVPLQALAVAADFLLLAGAAVGLVSSSRNRGRPGILYAAVAFFSLVQIVFHAEARFRLPLIPLVCMLSGIGVTTVAVRDRLVAFLSEKKNIIRASVAVAALTLLYAVTGILFLKGIL